MVRPPNPFGRGIAHPYLYDAFEEGVTAGMKAGRQAMVEWVEEHKLAGAVRFIGLDMYDNPTIQLWKKDWQQFCEGLEVE